MQLGELKENRPKYLIGAVSNQDISYGDKFQKFSTLIYSSFERIAAFDFTSKIPNEIQLPLAVLGSILFIKNRRCLNDDFTGLEFLDSCKAKLRDIAPQLNGERLVDFMRTRIVNSWNSRIASADRAGQLCDMMAAITEKKGKEAQHYNEQHMKKIGSFFGEKVVLINYDENKGALTDRTLSYKSIYVLKAKDLFFLLFKEQDIEAVDRGTMTHEELASLFGIENKLQKLPQKQSANSQTSIEPKSPVKSYNKLGSDIRSTGSGLSETSMRLKPEAIFPKDVKCSCCGSVVSQFGVIFWNYSNYCLECVMSPKVDTSFVPGSLIEKFLKTQKIDSREYTVVCYQCQSDTVLPNYRPWEKPKNYRCKACLKDICVQHQRMISECFCHCQKCDKRTLTIPHLLVKLCLMCKTRHCQTCGNRDRKACACLCPLCGQNTQVDHEECHPVCHGCESREVGLMACRCGGKLCGVCYFASMEPNSNLCVPALK